MWRFFKVFIIVIIIESLGNLMKEMHFVIYEREWCFEVLKMARADDECDLKNFKTSRATINEEMHEQVHGIFSLLYSK